jgi:hypothetical protein
MAELGTGLQIVDGDLVLRGGRLAELSGVENLAQALTLRILTPLGNDVFNTTYGLDTRSIFTGANGTQLTRDVISLNLVRTLGTDVRVREVRQVQFLEPVEGTRRRSWPVEVTVVTIDERPATLTLDVGV